MQKLLLLLFLAVTLVMLTTATQSNDEPKKKSVLKRSRINFDSSPHLGFLNGRVVGGTDAVPHSAPWIVSMQYGILLPAHRCGGSIIANNWVLTAGHCLLDVPEYGKFQIVAGRHDISVNGEYKQQLRNIDRSKTWIHESYKGGVAPYDIALIRMEPGFDFNAIVAPIELPVANERHTGDVRLHGWGSISTSGFPILPGILQTVVKPIISLEDCAKAFGSSPLHETNICTGPLSGGISACSGDSGGPITQNGAVLGIASWTKIPCGQPNGPTVYVAVSSFIDWIENIVENN